MESKLQHIDRPDDPERCQAIFKNGQCNHRRAEHSQFCLMHGGNKGAEKHRKDMVRKYQLAQWQARVGEFASDSDIKSLREEAGILRMVLEQIVVQCKTPLDVVLYSGKIGEMATRIEKLIVSCNRLEASTGALLDKGAALSLAAQMVQIIGAHVTDPAAIDAITTEIAKAIADLDGPEED